MDERLVQPRGAQHPAGGAVNLFRPDARLHRIERGQLGLQNGLVQPLHLRAGLSQEGHPSHIARVAVLARTHVY